jgi:purine nucleosidase
VDVETTSELTRGMTVVDRLNIAANPRNQEVWADLRARGSRAKVCWTLDVKRWKEALYSALR